MIGVNIIGIHKSGIKIKKSRKGLFTEYCGGKVTDECISRAKKSKNPKLRKRATFAANSRRWSHKDGGSVRKPFGHRSILDNDWQSIKQLKNKKNVVPRNLLGGIIGLV